jgi:hypothetical protein
MWLLNATACAYYYTRALCTAEWCWVFRRGDDTALAKLALRTTSTSSASRRISADITVGGGGYEVKAFLSNCESGNLGPQV